MIYNGYFIRCMYLHVYCMLVNVNGIYSMCMYVNKRVELAHRGIALKKMYVLLFMYCIFSPCRTIFSHD